MVEILSNPRPAVGFVRALSLLLLLGLFGIAAVPARADSYVNVALSDITVTGNNSCSPAPCSETFTISFEWDTSTESVVSSTISVNASGVLPNNFEYEQSCFSCSQPVFIFARIGVGDALDWYSSMYSFPSIGTFSATSPAFAVGFACASDALCVDASPDTSGCCSLWNTTSGTITVSEVGPVTTPEPSSLLLLGAGLVGVAGMRKRRPAQLKSFKDFFGSWPVFRNAKRGARWRTIQA